MCILSPMETNKSRIDPKEALRREVKGLMIDTGYDLMGSIMRLAEELGVNRQSLVMALSGYRRGPASIEYLERARDYLRRKHANAA